MTSLPEWLGAEGSARSWKARSRQGDTLALHCSPDAPQSRPVPCPRPELKRQMDTSRDRSPHSNNWGGGPWEGQVVQTLCPQQASDFLLSTTFHVFHVSRS